MDAGSSMLRNPLKLGQVTAAVVQAVPELPVTVKIRIGWDADTIVALEGQNCGCGCASIGYSLTHQGSRPRGGELGRDR